MPVMDETIKTMAEWKDKAAKWDNMRGTFLELAKRLTGIAEELNSVIKELNPAFEVKSTHVGGHKSPEKSAEIKKITAELFEKMQQGTHITTNFVETTYELTQNRAQYIIKLLKEMKGIDSAFDGRSIRLYARKA